MEDSHLAPKKRPRLTRRERLQEQKEQNKRWREHDRKVGSGVDPNPRHTKYFQLQLPHDLSSLEWTLFQQSMATPLPVVIRLGWACPREVCQGIARAVAAWRPRGFLTLPRASADGADTIIRRENPVASTLFPSECWQLVCDAQTLSSSEALSHVHGKICTHVAQGHLVRQELASQLPVLVAQVEPHHHVLDMCAAPGSKTEQLLGIVSAEAGGLVVANDLDKKRLSTLCQRLGAGAPHLLVIQSRAEDLPRLGAAGQFDRIICDVPCSGDGTLRKFPHLWRLFRPRVGVDLHSIQLQIAVAAAKLLKPGGRLVYSTCSINPIEDEAVVSGLLQHEALRGQLKLVKCSAPAGVVTRPGVSTWKCDPESFTVGEQTREDEAASLQRLPTLTESMRPPPPSLDLHLEYCHRILPHDQDTGGFFFCVLERLSESSGQVLGKEEDASSSVAPVSLQEATRTMKRLGYNPKAGGENGRRGAEAEKGDDEEEAEASSYHLLDQVTLCRKESNDKFKFISRDGQQVSVASLSVVEALSSWAATNVKNKKKNKGKAKRRVVVVRQAGAHIGFTLDSRFCANADHCAPFVASKCLGPEVAQVVEITFRQEFARLCALGATQRVVDLDEAGFDLGPARTVYVVFEGDGNWRGGDGGDAEEGKRRLSKAEKKRLKSGGGAPPPPLSRPHQSNPLPTLHSPLPTHGDALPMILTLQRDEGVSSLSFLTSAELCQTYSEAVLEIL